MTDEELDSALALALDVDPSPDLLARVRASTTADGWSPPVRGRWSLATGVLVSAAVVAAAIGLWPSAERPPLARETVAVSTPPAAAPGLMATVPAPAAPDAPRAISRPAARAAATARREPSASGAPAVLVSPEERLGFETLLARAREGRIPPVLPSDDMSARTALAFSKMEIPSIEVQPLPRIAPLEVQ